MSILSLNVRGLGKVERVRSLSKLFSATGPIIISLQEIMCLDSLAVETLANLLPSWEVVAFSTLGILGGLCYCWNPRVFNINPFKTNWGIYWRGT